MKFLPVKPKEYLAYLFTTTLHSQPFNTLLTKLKMVDVYKSPTCGWILKYKVKISKIVKHVKKVGSIKVNETYVDIID